MRHRATPRLAAGIAVLVVAVTLALVGLAVARIGPFAGGPRAAAAPRFVEESAAAGVDITYDGPFEYAAGGGASAFDCDDDGRPDLYVAGGEGPGVLFRNVSPVGGTLAFTRLTGTGAELDAENGAYPVDIDGDGHTDLVTLRNGENVVLRGLGGCRFERANEAWQIDGGAAHTEAFSATWEAGSAFPTLAFGNYNDPDSQDIATSCEANVLLRPLAGGDGAVRYAPPIQLTPSFCALSMLFSDWAGNGGHDLRVSNDRHYYQVTRGSEQLWQVLPGIAPRLYTAADGWNTVQVEGMGIASQDLTGDGLPEVYLTSQAASRLQALASGTGPAGTGNADATMRPTYVDVGQQYGVNVAHPYAGKDMNLPSTAWHPEFADVNNDGLLDLFVSKGNVTAQPDYAIEDPSNLLIGQPDGTFLEGAPDAGIVTMDRGRGAALVDLNLDGKLDLVESFYGAPLRIWRNTSVPDVPAGHWLAIRITQPGPNVDAIGARLEVRFGPSTTTRELTIGGGHGGGQLGWLHVGLGGATTARARVTWPGGATGPWLDLTADTFEVLDRAQGGAVTWTPAP